MSFWLSQCTSVATQDQRQADADVGLGDGDDDLVRYWAGQALRVGHAQAEGERGRCAGRGEGRPADDSAAQENWRGATGLFPAVGERRVPVGVVAVTAVQRDRRADWHRLVGSSATGGWLTTLAAMVTVIGPEVSLSGARSTTPPTGDTVASLLNAGSLGLCVVRALESPTCYPRAKPEQVRASDTLSREIPETLNAPL